MYLKVAIGPKAQALEVLVEKPESITPAELTARLDSNYRGISLVVYSRQEKACLDENKPFCLLPAADGDELFVMAAGRKRNES